LIKFSNTRVKSRDAKQGIRCKPPVIKKIDIVSKGIPRGVACLYVYGGVTKIFFNFLQGDFHG